MYKPVIGLEIHLQPKTKNKMYCSCSSDVFGKEPNSVTCPICLGLPGSLPLVNETVINHGIVLGLALNCKIAGTLKFDRKHYFYPDLPKGYQISQYKHPLAYGGYLEIDGEKIRITRVHLEEDTGKLFHTDEDSLVDYNRSGMPLIEVVTEPDIHSPELAIKFLKTLQLIVKQMDISSADMEKGSMRLEANLSLAKGDEIPDYKVEVKNVNSFRYTQKAIEFEIDRQTRILSSGEKVAQETRGYNEKLKETISQRSKEFSQDYRYFPEPDIPEIEILEARIQGLAPRLLQNPLSLKILMKEKYQIQDQYLDVFVSDQKKRVYFEMAIERGMDPKISANIIINNPSIINQPLENLEALIKTTNESELSEEELLAIVEKVLQENSQVVEQYKDGKLSVDRFLLGQIIKITKGEVAVGKVQKLLQEKLEKI